MLTLWSSNKAKLLSVRSSNTFALLQMSQRLDKRGDDAELCCLLVVIRQRKQRRLAVCLHVYRSVYSYGHARDCGMLKALSVRAKPCVCSGCSGSTCHVQHFSRARTADK